MSICTVRCHRRRVRSTSSFTQPMSHMLPTYVELHRKVATLTHELTRKDFLFDETIIGVLAIQERVEQLLNHIEVSRNSAEVSAQYPWHSIFNSYTSANHESNSLTTNITTGCRCFGRDAYCWHGQYLKKRCSRPSSRSLKHSTDLRGCYQTVEARCQDPR